MKKIDRIRNMEAARVLLIQAMDMITIANRKLAETMPNNTRIGADYNNATSSIDDMLRVVVDTQNSQK